MIKGINSLCAQNGISLCYLFGSRQQEGLARLRGDQVQIDDPESDIDFAVFFISPPESPLLTYAKLSIDLEELVSPYQADLVFLHEVDHMIQLEAIQGINIFAADDEFREDYEAKVMAFAADETIIQQKNEKDFLEAVRDGYFEFKYEAASG
jgi:predicted nucleotidyltransferase